CATVVGWGPINGGHPIRGRGSQHGLLRGCHVPSPGVMSTGGRFSGLASVRRGWSFSKAHWRLRWTFVVGEGEGRELGGESEGRKGEERGGEERGRQEDSRTTGQQDSRTAEGRTAAEAAAGPWASARQTAPLALLLRQPEASVWSAVALRTLPTLRPTYAPNLPTFQPSVQRYSLATKPTSTAVLNPQWRQYEPITNNCCFCFARGPAFVPLCLHFHQCTTGSSRHAQRAGH
ncbi:hypothetical protein F5882DRAFT_504314, partial [Hyaloscypha sp. PMI_1271]